MQTGRREIFKYEYKRCFFKKMRLWIAFCFLASAGFFWWEYRESSQDVLYKEIVEPYRGSVTQDKIEDIKVKTAHYEEALATHAEVSDSYARDKISDEEFNAFIRDYRHAKKYMDGWRRLKKNALRLEGQGGQECFFYEIAWEKLFANKIGWPFLFLLVTLLIPYFYMDREIGLQEIMQSYCNYPKFRKYRLQFAVMSAILLQIIWIAEETAVLLAVSSLPDGGMPVSSLEVCSGVSSSVSLTCFLALKNIVLILKRGIDASIVYFLSGRIKNKMAATVVLLLYLLVSDTYYLELLRWVL